MKRQFFFMIVLVCACFLWGFSESARLPAVQAPPKQDEPVDEELLKSLQGGPLKLLPATATFAPDVSKEQALKHASRWLGTNKQPDRVWKTMASDAEFIGGFLKNRPCWLLEYRTLKLATTRDPDSPAYVLIDAENGRFWQAFTRPARPWWDRLKFRNEQVVKRYDDFKIMARPSNQPPKAALLSALPSMLEVVGKYEPDQITARSVSLTRGNTGWSIRRIDNFEMIPLMHHHPVWYVYYQGVASVSNSGRPALPSGRPSKAVVTEEIELRISADSGNLLDWGHYR